MNYTYILILCLSVILFSCNKESHELQEEEEVSISGSVIMSSNGSDDVILLEGVTVTLLQDGEMIQSTQDASFRFDNLEAGRNYTIVPEKLVNASNVVSTYDVALIKSYINGNTTFDIGQLVAADLDRNLIINQNDIDILTDCLESNVDDCLEWRFYHEDCESLDQEELINEIQFNNLNSDKLDMRIFARETGSLN